GECEVVRAFYYFNLVNVYGGVPLVTGTFFQTNMTLPRASVDTVYGQITKDLLDARARMSAAYPSPGRLRPNRYTADALLARTYLYRGQWDSALIRADTVIRSGLYSLTPSLDNVFLDGSPEAIWQVGSSSTSSPKTPPGNNPYLPGYVGGLPSFALTQNVLQAFETGDTRKTRWTGSATGIVFDIDPVTGTGNVSFLTYPYSNKYRNLGNAIYNNTTEDLMMIRLAEMYLIRSEARARLGDLAGAMQDVNTIRSRAGLTAPVTAATLPDALGLILHERQVELFCEWGHRWMDLKRMDSINPVLTREKPSVWPADGHLALYPISFGEIQADPYLKQNPGY
ncbi:MAG TPA: RagB/SusD family nutrient uptake outer membrane protein, partial [Puia sp.]|nr:RagB/SusD family nutrient uptake outer membrane protein [Puia sp.]